MSDENEQSTFVNRRKELGLTQEDIAKALGVTPRTVIYWENGHHEPKLTINQIKQLCRLMKWSIEEVPERFGPLTKEPN